MNFIYLPDQTTAISTLNDDDPVYILIKHDLMEVILGSADIYQDHIILLRHANKSDSELGQYYRVLANNTGADWAFECPEDYKGISDKEERIKQFYADGLVAIKKVLKQLNLIENIEIPRRYLRNIIFISG